MVSLALETKVSVLFTRFCAPTGPCTQGPAARWWRSARLRPRYPPRSQGRQTAGASSSRRQSCPHSHHTPQATHINKKNNKALNKQTTTSTESNPCQHLMKMRRTPEGVAKSSRKESGLQPLRWPPTTLMALGPQPSATRARSGDLVRLENRGSPLRRVPCRHTTPL